MFQYLFSLAFADTGTFISTSIATQAVVHPNRFWSHNDNRKCSGSWTTSNRILNILFMNKKQINSI